MGRDVYEASEAARDVFAVADEKLGFSLSRLCFEGPADDLVPTEIQQPAILTSSIALHRCLQEHVPDLAPVFLAGHSLGEYTALVAAGSLAFEDAVSLVHARGRFMQQAVPSGSGAMAAVLGSSPEDVDTACRDAAKATGEVVAPANYNSPLQTVIAGAAAAVDFAAEREKHGMSQMDSIIDAGAKRARPIVMTTLAMAAGMLPAAMATGEGGEFRAPMAIAVIGGLLVSTVLSLVLIPSIYTLMDDLSHVTGRFFRWVLQPNAATEPATGTAIAVAHGGGVGAWPHPSGPMPASGPGGTFLYGPPAIYQIGVKPSQDDGESQPRTYPHAAE